MNRFAGRLMAAFRALQLLLSLAVLVCGAFMTINLTSMASSAHHFESTIEKLMNTTERQKTEVSMGLNFTQLDLTDQDVGNAVAEVDEFLVPILHVMEGTPVRAIILSAVSLWSICVIIYLFFAHRVSSQTWMNRRFTRVVLELITLLLWAVGIVCASLLSVEYGIVALTGSVPLKLAWSSIRAVVTAAMRKLFEDRNPVIALTIVDNVITIGALSIVAVVFAGSCGFLSLVSLFLACITSGKTKSRKHDHLENEAQYGVLSLTEKQAGSVVSQQSSSVPWLEVTRPAHRPWETLSKAEIR